MVQVFPSFGIQEDYRGGTGAWDCYSHVDIHKIHFAQSNGNIVYMGCDGGVYKSTDAGATWFNVNNNINTIQFYRVASHPTNSSIIFGGAQDNGNFSTSDKGTTNWVFELAAMVWSVLLIIIILIMFL